MTPYTPRNFAIGSPTAREGQLDRFFLQKWHFIYQLSVKKQRTGQKTGKKNPKKGFFSSPSDQLAEFFMLIKCREGNMASEELYAGRGWLQPGLQVLGFYVKVQGRRGVWSTWWCASGTPTCEVTSSLGRSKPWWALKGEG